MSEVKRISVFIHGPNKAIDMVEAVHLDRVTAEHDAALGREKECQRQLGERWKDIEALRSSLESAGADKEAYGQNAIDLRKRVDALQQRLTAADELVCERTASLLECGSRRKALEQRVDVLEGLLREASVELHDFITGGLLDLIDAALKPAEGGGDE